MVSVIIPTYNYAHLLSETLRNVKKQTYSNWECLVVDDGSTDNTREVVAAFEKEDPRFRYIHQPNSGPQIARNTGIREARGSFIQFLDADDLLEKEKLYVQTERLRSSAADIVYGDMRYFSPQAPDELFHSMAEGKKDEPWMQKVSGKGNSMITALLKENIMVISSPLIRKNVFDRFGVFDASLRYNEDWELWLRFAVNGVRFEYLEAPDSRALVRVHNSYSTDRFGMYLYGLKVCLGLRSILKERSHLRTLAIKILYHTRTIDREILSMSRVDHAKSVQMAELAHRVTGRTSYEKLGRLLRKTGAVAAGIYADSLFTINRVMLKFVYGY